MLDIGWTELFVIAVVAIIVVGPKDLPRMLRSLGQYAGKLRRTAGEFREQFDEAIRDSEFDELKSSVESVSNMNPMGEIRDAVTDSLDPLKKSAEEIKSGIESDGTKPENTKPAPGSDHPDPPDSWTDDAVEETTETPAPSETAEQSEPAPDPLRPAAPAAKSEA